MEWGCVGTGWPATGPFRAIVRKQRAEWRKRKIEIVVTGLGKDRRKRLSHNYRYFFWGFKSSVCFGLAGIYRRSIQLIHAFVVVLQGVPTFLAENPVCVRRAEPRVLDAADFARERLGLDLDARQEEVLRSTAKRTILNCSRQWGKSTIAAAKALHRAYTVPGCLVLVASPSDRQSSEFLRKAKDLVVRLGIVPRGDGDNETSLLFPNGSRIVGLPGTEGTGRGFSNASLLVIDEAARVEDSLGLKKKRRGHR